MEQQERATPRIIGALVARDAGCALRNPTVLLCAAVAAAFSWLFGATLADELTATPGFAVFLMAFATILPTLEAGGVVTLFAMSEEDAHGTYDVIVRGGASLEAIVAAKVIVGAVGCTVLVPVCLALAGAPRGCLGPAVLLTAVGSLPVLVLFCGCGLRAADQMRTNGWAWPLVVAGMLPLLGALGPQWAPLVAASPVGFLAGSCVAAATGTPDALGLPLPALAANLVAWLILALLWLRRCMKAWRSARESR